MPLVTLRRQSGVAGPDDLVVSVQDATHQYLLTSASPEIRVSAYLDRDHERVASRYAELFVDDACPWVSEIKRIVPGSKTRKDIALPGPMTAGEQIVVLVKRRFIVP